MNRYRVITSTINYGTRWEQEAFVVFASDEERATEVAERLYGGIIGFKFERVELIK